MSKNLETIQQNQLKFIKALNRDIVTLNYGDYIDMILQLSIVYLNMKVM